ncbi:MAG: hypothetical protein KGS61_21805 [Verrucomicrobia bacterium]|nr:hypothetical protein [Verrucomicrobiota bacterium]
MTKCGTDPDRSGNSWQTLEHYRQAHPQVTLTTVTCPECVQSRFLEPFERD